MKHALTAAAVAWTTFGMLAGAQTPVKHPDFSGSWTFDASQSDRPRDPSGRGDDAGQPGTNPAVPGGGNGGRGRGGFGGRGFGGGGSGGFGRGRAPRGNTDDRVRALELTDEVRNPPATLAIVQKGDTVTVVDGNSHTRVFHTTGKKDTQQLEAVKVDTKTVWDGDRLVTEYDLGNNRKLRYIYSLADDPRQLLVEATFESGKNARDRGDTSRFVYDVTPPASR